MTIERADYATVRDYMDAAFGVDIRLSQQRRKREREQAAWEQEMNAVLGYDLAERRQQEFLGEEITRYTPEYRFADRGCERGHISAALRLMLLERDEWRCHICAVALTFETCHIDHLIPVARGGETAWDNLAASCQPCNNLKHAGPIPARSRYANLRPSGRPW